MATIDPRAAAIHNRRGQWKQPTLLWAQSADSTALVDSVTETSFDQYPTFKAGSLCTGDMLYFKWAGIFTTDATVDTFNLGVFWGTQAGTALIRSREITLGAVAGSFVMYCSLYFRSAISVVPVIDGMINVTSNTSVAIGKSVTAQAITQTADTPVTLTIDFSAAGTATEFYTNLGECWFVRNSNL